MLATMSQHAEMPPLTWSELGVSELLPTGTVTLLLADVEGSTRLWETQPEQMTAALAALNRTVNEAIAAHDGVRPVEQGEGDSFVAAEAIRQRMGHARFPMYQAGYNAAVAVVQEALGQNDFDLAWAEGAALSTEEAIAYAQRGRGERKRPASGWGSLTWNVTWCVWSVKDWATRTSARGFSSPLARCKPTSPMSTPSLA
jgi:class 3 adenylate cyclase